MSARHAPARRRVHGPAAALACAALALFLPRAALAQAKLPTFLSPASPAFAASAAIAPPVPVVSPVLGWTADQFRVFVEDGWDVLTFWRGFGQRELLTLAGAVGVGGLLLALDEPLQDAVARNTEWGPLNWLQETGEFFDPLGHMGKTNRYYIAGWLVGGATGWDDLESLSREILYSHYIAALTRQVVRDLVGRQRPFDGEGAYAFGDGTSFPSGHASSIFQVAAVVSDKVDRWPATLALYTIASVVSWERISSGSHWPSDVWIGALWGAGVARIVLRNAERREEGFPAPATPAGARLRLAPDPASGLPALLVTLPVGGG